MASDPHYVARGLFERLSVGDHSVAFPAVGPKLERTPAMSRWAGRELGADTRRVLAERLKLSAREIDELAADGVVAVAPEARR
jgi:crotonobetainyl-CoA:carnitine CoA-transferase CaiB-like acyl-CoA transferase